MTAPLSTFEVKGTDATVVVEFDDRNYFDEFLRFCGILYEVTGKYTTRNVIEGGDEKGAWWKVIGLTDAQVIQIKMLW